MAREQCLTTAESDCSGKPLMDLPDALLEQVLRTALGDHLDDVLAVASVCKRWRRAAYNAALKMAVRGVWSADHVHQYKSIRELQVDVTPHVPGLLLRLGRQRLLPQLSRIVIVMNQSGTQCLVGELLRILAILQQDSYHSCVLEMVRIGMHIWDRLIPAEGVGRAESMRDAGINVRPS